MSDEMTLVRPAVADQSGARMIIAAGRGKVGKSVTLRWIIEEMLSRGGEPVIADADRTNPTLLSFFAHATRPASAEDDDVRLWLNDLVDTQIEKRTTVFLDLGGGDQMLKQWSRELDLAAFLEQHGITPVLLHLLGSDVDDLAYLRDLETVYAPKQTALILNEGMVPAGRSAASVFEPVVADPIFKAAMKRGAKVVRLPRLGCMQEVDRRRLSFEAAEQPGGLTPTMRQMVTLWRRAVPDALAPVLPWIL
jgi:hypothetical protein